MRPKIMFIRLFDDDFDAVAHLKVGGPIDKDLAINVRGIKSGSRHSSFFDNLVDDHRFLSANA